MIKKKTKTFTVQFCSFETILFRVSLITLLSYPMLCRGLIVFFIENIAYLQRALLKYVASEIDSSFNGNKYISDRLDVK